MPIHGIYPSIAQPTSAAAEEPGPANLTYEPVSLFAPTYWWNFTDAESLTLSSGEITGCSNSGSASGGDATRENSVGPDWSDAIEYCGYHKGAEIENTISGGGTSKTMEATVSISPWDEPRSYLVVWSTDDGLNTSGTTRCPVAFQGTDGADASVVALSTTADYQFHGSHLRSTNGLTQVDDIFRAALITGRTGQWNRRRITSYVSNSSSVTSSLSVSQRVVDTVIIGRFSSSAGRTLRGYIFEIAVFPFILSASEANSLMRALCYKYSGNSSAQSAQSSLPITWVDSDWSTSHASLSHEPFLYADFQTASTVTTSTDEEAFTCDTDDEIEVASDNTISAGDHVTLSTTGTLPTGLSPGNYFVRSRNSTTLTLVSDYDDVWDSTAALSISSGTGTGVHTLSRSLIESISCDHNAVRHFDVSGTKATYIASSGAQPGRFVGNAASNGSYVWTNASEQNDGSIMIVARKYGSGSNSGRAASVGSQSAGDQWIEFGGVAGRARSRYAGSIVTCGTSSNPSYTDGEIFVAYFVADSSSGHRLRIFDADTGVWTESSLDSSSIGEKFYERWQDISIETGSKMEILELVYVEAAMSVADHNTNNAAFSSTYGFQHSDLS